ncbi:MAG TPA: class I SAM-dependent methyltransferase [Steroidobacteraceae bacterium]|nr:class I SAM-dependent methyltransferase [Steroidobacteraceae bacterium]
MSNTQESVISPLIEHDEGGLLRGAIRRARTASRLRRSALFRSLFELGPQTRILDLGGSNGAHVHSLLAGTPVRPENVHVADVDHQAVRTAASRYGFMPVALGAEADLPFGDAYFDIVLCSSVLEHVTIPQDEIWRERSTVRFRQRAQQRQQRFAREIERVTRGYFVQVPNRWFPIETHTWLPFVGYMPRSWQLRVIGVSNRLWIKKTAPNFYLPTAADMTGYFPAAALIREKVGGMTKSLIMVKGTKDTGRSFSR